MSSQENPTPRSSHGSPVTPLLRAVLLADLVDSTAFVQRFGDARAAVALQRLDLQIRDLLEFTGGRLIDKADGLLALFERPVQAVDFALRYQQALRLFSSSEDMELAARVGIHVGEVMTWTNTPDAIAAGSKPLEVEGLAKPVAARLMTLALPGQILLSSMAMTLAQRAQAELGERAERVRWIAHGRYRFKGVPTPLVVHEVGESGFAPLRQPPSGQKVWRELPIWRRPPVLALEFALVAALVSVYAYGLFRSPPALAFNERDWVVIGDLSNFTGDPRLEESLEAALRISLEQSRYVNIVPAMKMQDVLLRMGRSQQATVDRAVGSEIALREGARVLLLPSVAEIGGRLRVNLEVIDPNTQTTIFAQSAEGRGAESALASIDKLNSDLRSTLGESMGDLASRARPLAEVSTSDLDALRAYSLAEADARLGHAASAQALYQQALRLDPKFAMAQVGLARILAKGDDIPGAWRLVNEANGNRDRLTRREQLQLDAFIARFGPAKEAMARYKVWADLYPDSFRAYYDYSLIAWGELQSYQAALDFLGPALSAKSPFRGDAFYLKGAILLSLNRYEESRAAFRQSEALGNTGIKLEFAEAYAAERDFDAAHRVLKSQTAGGVQQIDLRLTLDEPLFLLDQGRIDDAIAEQEAVVNRAARASPMRERILRGTLLSMQHYGKRLDKEALRSYLASETMELAAPAGPSRSHAQFATLAAGWLAAREGDLPLARKALAAAAATGTRKADPAIAGMHAILEAELALDAGDPAKAARILVARHDGTELYFSHALLMRAHEAQGDNAKALVEARWLATHRGQAYAEYNSFDMWNAANIAESGLALLRSAELSAKMGKPAVARQQMQAFLKAWPGAAKLDGVGQKLAALSARLKSVGT